MPKPEMDTRFAKFGTVSFTAVTKVNDFIGYLEEGKVTGTKCKKCGEVFFPPRADCYKCLDSEVEWFTVEGTGKLETYSQLMYAPIGFGEDLPYAIAVLDYGDYKVFGRIGDVPFEELEIGMEMVTRANELPNGNLNYVFEKA
ncbi:MAG: Zn-ribbon domain-containing OB-fold protein [Desulfarculaceae bacterium]|nr:Zn-ribbon domain-containing OB-fold protein [Desulfarculaceae bacterium]MCF8073099.1 Zn-ribbon domain-containing OB-fold protein [Desulfarculaceae bacterium]MCF8101816.1 Zn-ribbon domain-containing OB-fold protein [Desulfarculaceae bacterium]MCF8115343.1 Zn-ribbon domain-containing OB-fold protein [Desulfarculaceae bacterium]